LTQTWYEVLEFKIESNSDTFTNSDAINILVVRPENSISNCVLQISDFQSVNYVDKFNLFDTLKVSFRYSDQTSTWTKVFEGKIKNLAPSISVNGEVLEVGAWGKGEALNVTHCNTSYGVESQNQSLETPKEIWSDLIDNYVNKSFGGAATGYAVTKTKIADIQSGMSITHLPGKYQKNFDLLCRVCDLVSAYAQAQTPAEDGCHWFVDEDANLFVNTVGAHENNASGWPTYWEGYIAGGTAQENSKITVTEDMILYNFQRNMFQFANKIVMFGALRKPTYDYWAESAAANTVWTADGTYACTFSDDTVNKVVGANSLKSTESGGGSAIVRFYYPSSAWGIDLSAVGSKDTIPKISFYARRDSNTTDAVIYFYTTRQTDDYAHNYFSELAAADTWYQLTFPIGPYYRADEQTPFNWVASGSPSWSTINGIEFVHNGAALHEFWIDDPHIHCSSYCRVASNTTSISSYDEFQRVIKNDVALDDTLKASDDAGTMAQLAYAELLRRQKQPTVAIIQTPLAINALPGQLIYVEAHKKSDNTYRTQKDFRATEIRHVFSAQGAKTVWNLTDDVDNSFAYGAPTAASLMHEYVGALGHKEARDLKSSGIDPLVSRLVKDYP